MTATHYVNHDAPGRRRSRALCGLFVDRREHANEPSCVDCARLRVEAELGEPDEVFGPPPVATQVHTTFPHPAFRSKGATR